MANACDICGKKRMVSLNVSHSNRKSKRVQKANIQRVRVRTPKGGVTRMHVCTRCIRTGLVKKA